MQNKVNEYPVPMYRKFTHADTEKPEEPQEPGIREI